MLCFLNNAFFFNRVFYSKTIKVNENFKMWCTCMWAKHKRYKRGIVNINNYHGQDSQKNSENAYSHYKGFSVSRLSIFINNITVYEVDYLKPLQPRTFGILGK